MPRGAKCWHEVLATVARHMRDWKPEQARQGAVIYFRALLWGKLAGAMSYKATETEWQRKQLDWGSFAEDTLQGSGGLAHRYVRNTQHEQPPKAIPIKMAG